MKDDYEKYFVISFEHNYNFKMCLFLLIDLNYKSKLLQGSADSAVESCNPNPCLNGGKCVSSSSKKSCQCIGYFTGELQCIIKIMLQLNVYIHTVETF